MSHFTVLVHIPFEEAQDGEIQDLLAAKLQPFHEFECTGVKDQYVQEYDETEEQLASYEIETTSVVYKDGEVFGTRYGEQCERFWVRNGLGISSSDEFVLPEGYELRENVPIKEVYTFEEYLTSWQGYSMDGNYSDFRDGRFYRYTNPNRKWDWWTVGGRWSGHFLTKEGNHEDMIQVHDWDLAGAMANAVQSYVHFFEKYEASGLNELEYKSWSECVDLFNKDYNAAREYYHSQEIKTKIRELFSSPEEEQKSYLLHDVDTFYKVSRESFIKARVFNEIGTFAVLSDGQWVERGDMGWFGMVSDENANWDDIYLDKIREFGDNDYLILIDCHI
ncbi:hypothetical protein FDH34_gp357 [Serratia phage BF]|uniref:Uncharacterized protein n=2 Tax=Eneladusvirus BF TaxID=2560751 RepID=A0A7L8ZLI3_9CAUD|nr:hypothetical protein FDH34_gp357 [Serratia phage BF]AQW88882.1 hypothetical protein BF_0357 [Serratia phage BF]QOI71295.1 hypothetical protein pEaSNUABM12_00357 [Erwinia phage pEa_SNUABM_12]QXO11504.1 hypothetical protein pEaSNUABM19_00358 [Erwinia phage pEa_SNUABM_19]QXO12052.1 hypothetical protein pEaSNUABM44_00356 [Erwinia phage pEa_SNUABM_44]